jgi:hypothetical protein
LERSDRVPATTAAARPTPATETVYAFRRRPYPGEHAPQGAVFVAHDCVGLYRETNRPSRALTFLNLAAAEVWSLELPPALRDEFLRLGYAPCEILVTPVFAAVGVGA